MVQPSLNDLLLFMDFGEYAYMERVCEDEVEHIREKLIELMKKPVPTAKYNGRSTMMYDMDWEIYKEDEDNNE